jgi:hypothetical protein
MKTAKEKASHEESLRMILMIAACFAIGSTGFFLAVFLENSNNAPIAATDIKQLVVTQQDKEAILRSLSASSSPIADATVSAGASVKVSPMQADPSDHNAAAKMKILESLSAK